MKSCSLVSLALFAILALAVPGQAQEEDAADPLWYVSAYNIPWAKVDSLRALVEADQPLVAEGLRRGAWLEGKILVHHTATEWNVIFMTKFPTWAAIDDAPGLGELAEELGWSEERRQARSDGFSYIFEGASAHRDWIYSEVATAP